MGGVALQACVNAYTQWLAKQHPKLVINSCTPGFIATDITKGMGATNPPEKAVLLHRWIQEIRAVPPDIVDAIDDPSDREQIDGRRLEDSRCP